MTVIKFDYHSAKRMRERLNINIKEDAEFDISKNFTYADSYLHKDYRYTCEAYCYDDLVNKVVLIVRKNDRTCQTVYIGGALNERNTPFVDRMYNRAYARIINKLNKKT